ncbi:unnamed protein product, partial [Ectocarpus sp. 12 AP-2014]
MSVQATVEQQVAQLGTNPAMLEQLLMEMFVPDTA